MKLPFFLPRKRIIITLFLLIWGNLQGLRAETGSVVAGKARFEVITPHLIRMEYAPDGKFVNDPSWFAINRDARDVQATILNDGTKVDIDTGKIHLVYRANGKPFSADNLSAEIKKDSDVVTWQPGMPSTGNLGGTIRTLDQVSGPVPLGEGVLSRDGWYLLDDSKSDLFFGDWIKPRPDKDATDWYLFGYGLDYRAALRSCFTIGGPIPLPRKYTLGIWYSRYWSYTSEEFKKIVQEYDEHQFPLDMLVLDMGWHLNSAHLPSNLPPINTWTGYTWNKQLIPDPSDLLHWIHAQGLHLTLNDHPAAGVQPHEEMYADFMRAMGQDPSSNATIPFDAGDNHYLDTFYQYTHLPREKEGVDFWWLDWQQNFQTRRIPDLTNLAVLNYYYYMRTSANGLRGQSFSRWAGWGDHRYPIQFSGDAFVGWSMLAFEVPFTSTAGNVGAFFWSHDIGGHQPYRNEESYTRWCQFGALTAALRSHSTQIADMDRRPWNYPAWAEKSMQVSFQLRARMMPYLYTSMWQATHDSVPYLRPLYLDHAESEDAYHNGQEYTFGDNLLVAPITTPGVGPNRTAWQAVWFPGDDWYDYFTGEKFTGPSYAVASAEINSFPLFVRGGVPLPMQPYNHRPATVPLTKLILRCYPGREGVTGKSLLYEDDGTSTRYKEGERAMTSLSYLRRGAATIITIGATEGRFKGQPEARQCILELPCTEKLSACSLATAQTGYDEKTRMNTITLPTGSIRTPITVTIQARETAPGEIASKATRQKIVQLLGLPDDSKADTSGADQVPADLREAYAAAQGVAFVQMNQHPYFLGHDTVLRFIHNHNSEAEKAAVMVEDNPPKELTLVSGQPLDFHGILPNSRAMSSSKSPALPAAVPILITLTGSSLPVSSLITHAIIGLDSARNIASQATVESSSGNPLPAVDGVIDGYPRDRSREWSSQGEKIGAWIRLSWAAPVGVNSVALYDRPNPNDHILAGTIEFSDGSTQEVGELPDDATIPFLVSFPKKTIQWLKFTVNRVDRRTQNIGLAEIAVLQAP